MVLMLHKNKMKNPKKGWSGLEINQSDFLQDYSYV